MTTIELITKTAGTPKILSASQIIDKKLGLSNFGFFLRNTALKSNLHLLQGN